MKILAYGDVHVHNFPEFSKLNSEGYSSRVELAVKSLRYVLDYAVENRIEHVINLGDIVEQSKTINTVIGGLLSEVLGDSKYSKLKHYFIVGNHDQVDRQQNHHVANLYRKCFTEVISCPDFYTKEESNYLEIDGYRIVFLPYTEEYSVFVDILNSISTEYRKKTLVFGHWSIDGVRFSEDYPTESKIKQILFDQFKLVVMGHIHLRQKLSNNIVYPGSLLSHSFKDCSGDKGFLVFDTETGTHELLNNPHSPKFHVMEISSMDDFNLIKQSDTDFYRLKIKYDEIYKYKDMIESMSNISVSPDSSVKEAEVRIKTEDGINEEDLILNYTAYQNESKPKTTSRYGRALLSSSVLGGAK